MEVVDDVGDAGREDGAAKVERLETGMEEDGLHVRRLCEGEMRSLNDYIFEKGERA